jgi:hypothetical protein
VSRLLALVTATVLLTTTASFPSPGTTVALAAPAMLSAAFRDLPASVRAGDPLAVQVAVPSNATCDGVVTFRDSERLKLDTRDEVAGRCRWDVTVPTSARRGTADIDVTVRRDSEQTTVSASLQVTARGDDLEVSFHDLPAAVRRGDEVTVRADVTDGSSCTGTVTYDDGRTVALPTQDERRRRCRWDITVPSDAPYGPAKIRIDITEGNSHVALSGSFEVARESDDAQFVISLKNLPASARGDDVFAIRALVPAGAKCSGSVAYYGATQTLDAQNEANGECVWSSRVPTDTRPGIAEVRVTARQDGHEEHAVAGIPIGRGSSSIGATFKDLATEIRRGQDLEIRVNVPNGATCAAAITFFDSDSKSLGSQTEHKDRCLWSVDIDKNTPRGTATVTVVVGDGGDTTTLLGNVEVLGKDEASRVSSSVTKASWGDGIPSTAKPGDTFTVRVNAPNDVTCTGKILYADGMKWVLGKREEESSLCQWDATVPMSVGAGKATVEVTVSNGDEDTKLTTTFQVN